MGGQISRKARQLPNFGVCGRLDDGVKVFGGGFHVFLQVDDDVLDDCINTHLIVSRLYD